MKELILVNSFSIQMMDTEKFGVIFREITPKMVLQLASWVESQDDEGGIRVFNVQSYIGHEDTAKIISKVVGIPIPCERRDYHHQMGDVVVVAQLVGGRLPEGCTTLPPEVVIRFFRAEFFQLIEIETIRQIRKDLSYGGFNTSYEVMNQKDWGDLLHETNYPKERIE